MCFPNNVLQCTKLNHWGDYKILCLQGIFKLPRNRKFSTVVQRIIVLSMLLNLWIEFYGESKEEDINCEPKCKITIQ